MSIQESNKLIAEFDGWKERAPFVNSDNESYPWWEKWENGKCVKYCHHNILKSSALGSYDTSWDWIMPVIEKIGGLRVKSAASYNPDLMFKIEIVNGYTEIKGTGTNIFFNSSVEGSMLAATHKAVVYFIQWYNDYNSQQSNTK